MIGSWIRCATATWNAPSTATVATTRRNTLRPKQNRAISAMQTRGSVYLCPKKIIPATNRLVFIFHWRHPNYPPMCQLSLLSNFSVPQPWLKVNCNQKNQIKKYWILVLDFGVHDGQMSKGQSRNRFSCHVRATTDERWILLSSDGHSRFISGHQHNLRQHLLRSVSLRCKQSERMERSCRLRHRRNWNDSPVSPLLSIHQ